MDKSPDDKLSSLWHSACNDYARETGVALTEGAIPNLSGPEDLSRQLESEKDHFEDFRMKRRPLLHAMQTVLAPFESWGDLIAGVAAAAFPPASSIMGAMLLLVRGARRVSDAFNMITDLFQKLGNFALRLESYKGVPLSEGMKTIIVKVLVNFLRVCAASQKLLTQGSLKARLSKWAKNVFVEDTSISSLFGELEELTSQEHLMVSAHGLKITHQALRNTEELLEREERRSDRERLQRVKAALQPVSASSQVFSSINENRIPGSARWVDERLRAWWESSQPLLWIHGGPGVGKSHIASKIITELESGELSGNPAPAVASFFCRNNDVDLRSLNKALRTLAWQVAAQRPGFAAQAEEYCLKEDPGNSYAVWRKLLMKHFDAASASPTCFVIDGLDEADPEEQEILFGLLEKTFSEDTHTSAPLRIVLLSRDSVGALFEEHALVCTDIEVGTDQNIDDLHGYISQKLEKTKLFRGSPELREETVSAISKGAEGLWEWANLVIKSVLRCRTKDQIRKVVRAMPRGITAMLHEELQRLSKELSASDEMSDEEGTTRIDQLNVLLSLVALAQRPLTVVQLELMLQIIFEEEVLNLEDDLRTLYSSLFLVRTGEGRGSYGEADVVILRHSSFYEFFRTSEDSGPIHVSVDQAEANFLYVTLYAIRHRSGSALSNPDMLLGPATAYAEMFLTSHLTRARPEQAGGRAEAISNVLEELFAFEPNSQDWLILEFHWRSSTEYSFHPDSEFSELGSFWMTTGNRRTANERAELALNWLPPDTRQRFVDNARDSDMASDASPFTVLFSFLVSFWYRRWLEPGDIQDRDGFPGAIPSALLIYREMASTAPAPDEDGSVDIIPNVRWNNLAASEILSLAEAPKLQKSAMWHARVAQSLLLNRCYEEASKSFQAALDSHQESPSLSVQSLSVIHRDMSRAYTETRRHKEALAHLELFESLHDTLNSDDGIPGAKGHVERLLHRAQMRHRAKLPQDALAAANEAWEGVLNRGPDPDFGRPDMFPFFAIFLELHQPHRLRSVFDFGSAHSKEMAVRGVDSEDFADSVLDSLDFGSHVVYRVLHHALTPEDHEYLDLIAGLLPRVDTLDRPLHFILLMKYALATVLFEKGRISLGIQIWSQVAAIPNEALSDTYNGPLTREWSISHLVRACLDNVDPPFEYTPITLDESAECNDVSLAISSWLRDHGSTATARDALRGRIRSCVALLSDDDPSNDLDAFTSLFKTFLAAGDSPEDLDAALYLIKQDEARLLNAYEPYVAEQPQDDEPGKVAESVSQMRIESQHEDDADADEDELDGLNNWMITDKLSECAGCRVKIQSIFHWYFCRSCPFSSLCSRCYRQYRASDDPSSFPGICNPQHEFYYTGGLLKPSERLPEGKVPLMSPDGERRVVWVEEWKDSLAEKWQTADFAFEGGLSAWCMQVLPEPQRSQWAKWFTI
ncbi:NACHT domain protein [Aspergillus lucknowensis]|uniref:Fungal STAND N-terminal Goodbye domain-containing protein n=1 Tax=Aspergillus lucknowensis TaxID=176173 RepID=A0ABR4LGL7_9EURO